MGYKPTVEELKFVYKMILDGCTNREIFEEYARLLRNGQLMFPLRADDRFLKARRKELEAASEVLQEHVRRRVDPVIARRREQHFSHLADIARVFLDDGLDTVDCHTRATDSSTVTEYYIGDSRSSIVQVTKELLSYMLDANEEKVCLTHGERDIHVNFLPHLKAEYTDIEDRGFNRVTAESPYELIEILRVLAERGTFQGTCPVCRDW